VCGTFVSSVDAESLTAAAEGLLPLWVEVAAGGSVCRPELEGYRVEVTTDGNTCMPLQASVGCFLPLSPFPNCT
jgi:hypothetical protein